MYAEVKHPKNTRVDRVTGLCRRGACAPKHVTGLRVMSAVMTDTTIRVLPSLISRFFYWRRLDLFVAFYAVLMMRVTVDAHYCLNPILNVCMRNAVLLHVAFRSQQKANGVPFSQPNYNQTDNKQREPPALLGW